MSRHWRELGDRWLATRLAMTGRAHQYPEILALRRFIRHFKVDCVIDVGANAGQYGTMLRRDVGFAGQIVSFEPNPAVFRKLEARAANDPRWHCHHVALSDGDGTASFNIMAADQFSSLNAPADGQDAIFRERNVVAETVAVETRRLDGLWPVLVARHAIVRPLLKLDTQGHDLAVCRGAGAMLGSISGVQSELSVRPLYAGGTPYATMIEWLEERGFVPSAFFANNKGHFPRLVEMDGLFVRAALIAD